MKRLFLVRLVEIWRLCFSGKPLQLSGAGMLQPMPANAKLAHRHIGSNVYVMNLAPAKSQNADLFKRNSVVECAKSGTRKQFDAGYFGLAYFTNAQLSARVWLVRKCAKLMGVAVCVSVQPALSETGNRLRSLH